MVMRIVKLLGVGALLLPLGTAVAFADDGPPRQLLTGPGRPPETIERVVNVSARGALVTIRGYASTPNDARDFDALAADMPDRAQYDLGTTLGTYDTRGDIRASGRELRDEIRRLVREEDFGDVRIVSVSMGGVVADEAFRSGLSATDNVKTWTTIASPLNGSTTALAVVATDRVASLLGAHRELDELLSPFRVGLSDLALRQLAARRRFSAPPGVQFTQFRAALDPLVSYMDAAVPGREVQTLTPSLVIDRVPAHGGQLKVERTREMVRDAAEGRRVRQSPLEALAAYGLTAFVERYRLVIMLGVAVGLVCSSVILAAARHLRIRS